MPEIAATTSLYYPRCGAAILSCRTRPPNSGKPARSYNHGPLHPALCVRRVRSLIADSEYTRLRVASAQHCQSGLEMWLFGVGCGAEARASTAEAVAPRGKVHFRPQLFYQRVLPEHIVSTVDCEIRLDTSTGDTWARLKVKTDTEVSADGEYARSCAVMVPDADSPGDEAAVAAVLRAASTWGDVGRIQAILSSCYCTARCCSEALAEASACGHDEAVKSLLTAGAPLFQTARTGKSVLHLACEAGHEAVAKRLLCHAAEEKQGGGLDLLSRCDDTGRTAIEVAVASELGAMARRLQKYGQELETQTPAA